MDTITAFDPCPYPAVAWDGLEIPWQQDGYNNHAYCNPPFAQITLWVQKALEERRRGAEVIIVCPRWFKKRGAPIRADWLNVLRAEGELVLTGDYEFLDPHAIGMGKIGVYAFHLRPQQTAYVAAKPKKQMPSKKRSRGSNLQQHAAHAKAGQQKAELSEGWACGVCGKQFATKGRASQHTKDVHTRGNKKRSLAKQKKSRKTMTSNKIERAASKHDERLLTKRRERFEEPKSSKNPSATAPTTETLDEEMDSYNNSQVTTPDIFYASTFSSLA